jgi:phosphoribosylanthranilate isomerase
VAEVKFCGLTRRQDAALGASLGAAFLGVVFAGGPRLRTPAEARALFEAASIDGSARRVGVFGNQAAGEIVDVAREAGLDVVQLHGVSSGAVVNEVRRTFGGEVWRVLRIRWETLEADLGTAAKDVEALVLDAFVDDVLGGSGVALNWDAVAAAFDRVGRPARLVLAGGLRPANVAQAIRLVAPEVVDVSSGVESAPGIKDVAMMRAFAEAARGGE